MVYAEQNYKVYFGLYPSSGIYKIKNHNVSETGSVSVLRWMGQDRPTQLGTETETDPVQNKPYSSVQHTPSSESFKLYSNFYVFGQQTRRQRVLD
jgi:hypothetical protein